ncbi:MAG: hypothetical protein RML36_12865 [Anaerolineae bacterium]|nr:hypothetical protein [Anaerolineae bacterium]MDW8100364.1 hypothetical protein [Anaerolineae bacterium]
MRQPPYSLAKWLLVMIVFTVIGYGVVQAQEGWQIGNIVGLRAGTCIREGPGFSYRAHTRVPEDGWAVRVIDGPRIADGKVWWDTSRRAAGDPSGGTGWVTEDQTDTDCSSPIISTPSPPDILYIIIKIVSSWMESLTKLWRNLPVWAQWGIAVVVLLMWARLIGRTLEYLLALLGALLGSAFLWIVMDLTREFWEPLWKPLSHAIFGANELDLALLLALLPLASWLLSTAKRLIRKI